MHACSPKNSRLHTFVVGVTCVWLSAFHVPLMFSQNRGSRKLLPEREET